MQEEIWKPVKGFEGRYEISNFGRIKSCVRGKWKLLEPKRPNTQGYYNMALWDSANGCKGKTTCVHRLVADAFCDKPTTNERLEIDHIDSNRLNNHHTNLRWLTSSQHRKISYEKGEIRRGEKRFNARLTIQKVLEIRGSGLSRSKLAKKYNVSLGTIQCVIDRRSWSYI